MNFDKYDQLILTKPVYVVYPNSGEAPSWCKKVCIICKLNEQVKLKRCVQCQGKPTETQVIPPPTKDRDYYVNFPCEW